MWSFNSRATARWMTFNRNDKFQTGGKLATLSVSRLGYLGQGNTMASLWLPGSQPWLNGELTMASVTYNVSSSTNLPIKKVGIWSSEQDLSLDDMMIWQTTASFTGWKDDRDDVAVSLTSIAGVAAMSALISSTLREKWSVNPLAVWSVAPVISRFLPHIVDRDLHKLAGEHACQTRSVQYASSFLRYNWNRHWTASTHWRLILTVEFCGHHQRSCQC